jgi:hypothetical protein
MILEVSSHGSTVNSYRREFDRIVGSCLVAMTIWYRDARRGKSIGDPFKWNPTDAVIWSVGLPRAWDAGIAVYDSFCTP